MSSRLTRMEISGLFGLYSHSIPLNGRERITAIIGPNGRGKTVCLKCIEALFNRNYSFYLTFPFSHAEFSFSGGESVRISNIYVPAEDSYKQIDIFKEQRTLEIQFTSADSTHKWTPAFVDPNNKRVRDLGRYLPFVERIGSDLWVDRKEGDTIALYEVINRYKRQLPPPLVARLLSDEPQAFRDLLSPIECHLIETQRLVVAREDMASPEYFDYHARSRAPAVPSLTVQQKAGTLKKILQDILAKYATLSQSLDRSFPRRVFEVSQQIAMNETDLRNELDRLDIRRKALMSAGILATEFEPVTMRGSIESSVARVLQIYIDDTDQKLAVFDEILGRISIFKEMIEQRFIDKHLEIDRECGFRVVSTTGHGVPLEKLSSGEQHQLILIFELLFEVTPNSLILIDEPELSLHVTWQKSFIESLQKMIRLNHFDVVIATHSPPLVARHFGLTVELGPVDDEAEIGHA